MKKLIVTLLAVVMVAVLIGCGQGAAPAAPADPAPAAEPATEEPAAEEPAADEDPAAAGEAQWRGAVVMQALSNESNAFMWREFQRFAPDYGFELIIVAGENEPAVEVAGIESAIAQGFDAVWANPSSSEALVPVMMQAQEAGMITAMVSVDLPPEASQFRYFFTGSNDYEAGLTAARVVIETFPDGANVVEVGGHAGHAAQINRRDGFLTGIAGSNITILDSQNAPTGWNADEAMSIMEDFIVMHGDAIDVVFCHWDNGASGVIEALQNAGRDDVFVIGVDGNRTGWQQVVDGTQHLSIGLDFSEFARVSLQHARTMLEGGTVPEINFPPFLIMTAETVGNIPEPPW